MMLKSTPQQSCHIRSHQTILTIALYILIVRKEKTKINRGSFTFKLGLHQKLDDTQGRVRTQSSASAGNY